MQISVIIPVFNSQKFIEKAINSAISLNEVQEVIIINDGSTDNTISICKDIATTSEKVKIINHSDNKNHGVSQSRNLGIEKATCDFIAFLDSDDTYLKTRFEEDKKIFESNKNIDGVYNAIGIAFYDDIGQKRFNKYMKEASLTTVKSKVPPENLFFHLLQLDKYLGYFHMDGLTIRRESLKKMPELLNTNLRIHEDSEFSIRLSYYLRLMGGSLVKPVALRGVHDSNVTLAARESKDIIIKNQTKLWEALYAWSAKEEIPSILKDHFKKMITIYNILDNKKINIISNYHELVRRDSNLLYHACYYRPVHNAILGNGFINKVLYRIKNIIQQTFSKPIYYRQNRSISE